MRRSPLAIAELLSFVLALATVAVPAAADGESAARARSPSGLRLALRSGLALPLGDAFYASGALSDTIAGYVPLRVDIGYRIDRHFYVGVDAQYASILSNGCPAGSSCSGHDARAGFMIGYHFLPSLGVDPWLGAGMGYETMSLSRTVDRSSVDITTRGFELLDVDLGVDFRPTPSLRVGPVISTSIGRFSRVAVNDVSTSDFQTSIHAWVMLGFRGACDL